MPGSVLAIRTQCDAQALSRVNNIFAMRDIVPIQINCRRADPFLLIDLQLTAADTPRVAAILDRLREMVCVDRAFLVHDACDRGGIARDSAPLRLHAPEADHRETNQVA
ncbi:hypothetical protein [Sphingomonas sp.]|uniref:hypothetical protein n=1 Tax=Sphingomonas sp. TaxID=28214 RepID=UPI002B75A118|nr:hypothetical protein [Sphingomonas sp.]HWK35485.1 hypothetical protein [Sphingomonas sp.]